MKKCPYCAEEIQDDAVKCRFCGEFLKKKANARWFFNNFSLMTLFLCVGPLVLPLVWINPRFKRSAKLIITIVIAIITYFAWIAIARAVKNTSSYYGLAFY